MTHRFSPRAEHSITALLVAAAVFSVPGCARSQTDIATPAPAAAAAAPMPTPTPEPTPTPMATATPAPTPTPIPAAAVVAQSISAERAPDGPIAPNPALDFLAQLQAQNANVDTLWGQFTQVKESPVFLDTVTSDGEFWYRRPDLFRCDYKTPTESRFFIIGDTAMQYTPEIKQVDKYKLESGDQAPINQMLVGFGLNTAKILEVFDVRPAARQPADPALFTIEFLSRNAERTLEYNRIEVTFDRATKEPRRMYLEQGGEDGDTVDIKLLAVKRNEVIEANVFVLSFPPDVDVIEY